MKLPKHMICMKFSGSNGANFIAYCDYDLIEDVMDETFGTMSLENGVEIDLHVTEIPDHIRERGTAGARIHIITMSQSG